MWINFHSLLAVSSATFMQPHKTRWSHGKYRNLQHSSSRVLTWQTSPTYDRHTSSSLHMEDFQVLTRKTSPSPYMVDFFFYTSRPWTVTRTKKKEEDWGDEREERARVGVDKQYKKERVGGWWGGGMYRDRFISMNEWMRCRKSMMGNWLVRGSGGCLEYV